MHVGVGQVGEIVAHQVPAHFRLAFGGQDVEREEDTGIGCGAWTGTAR